MKLADVSREDLQLDESGGPSCPCRACCDPRNCVFVGLVTFSTQRPCAAPFSPTPADSA
jgi:hypothetical protein